MSYKIVRMFFNDNRKRVIMRGLSLEQAQAHCKDKETSSSTCTNYEGIVRTKNTDHGLTGMTRIN
jgi:hypothetical protein